MRNTTLKSFFAAVPLLIATSVSAADINFSGFATIAAGSTTSNEETYEGYTSDLDFNQDSLFALQISSDLGDGLSATAQLIARGENDWEPAFEWAFLGYDVSDNLRILAGRQRLPFFMYSDFLDVSYAYHWITPPTGVYNIPFDSFDGIGAIYSSQIGEFDSTLHVIAGRNQKEIALNSGDITKPDFNKLLGAAWTLNRDWLTLRAGYFQSEMTLDVAQLSDLASLWSQAGFNSVASNFVAEKDDINFAELGLQIDYEDYLLVAEFTRIDLSNTGQPDQDSYYVSLGKRLDNVMLYVTVGADDDALENLIANVPNVAALATLNAGTAGYIASQQSETKYVSVGAKWDFHAVSSLKFEVTKYTDSLADANDATLIKLALTTVF